MAEFGIDLSDFNGFDFSNLDLSGSYNPFVDTTAAPSYSPSSFVTTLLSADKSVILHTKSMKISGLPLF